MARLALAHADWAAIVRRELLRGCAWARSYAERRRGCELICDAHGLIRSHGLVSNAQVRQGHRRGYLELGQRWPQLYSFYWPTTTPSSHMQGIMLACAGVKVYGLTCDAQGVIHAQGEERSATDIGGATAAEADPEEGRCVTSAACSATYTRGSRALLGLYY